MRLPVLILPLILVAALYPHRTKPVDTLPPVMLWAWERPEDLSFIDPQKTGVAFLAKTIILRGDAVVVRPRLQPLRLAPGTKVTAVLRIETDNSAPPSLSFAQLTQVVKEVSSSRNGVASIQIDFDATTSERNFYRSLLTQLRNELPASTTLSITALASWCAGDDWLSDLPIDEAVPMLFRLGVDRRQFQRRLETGQPFESRMCQNSAGVSTDEPVNAPSVNRLYIFSPNRWSKSSFAAAMEAYQR